MSKLICSLLLFFVILYSLTGCTRQYTMSTSITVAGSTTMAPLMRQLALAYPYANIEIQELGTTAGINATISGTSHISMSSRVVTSDELAMGLVAMPIAKDGIVVIVHPNNPVTNLSIYQIQGIFEGYISNLAQIGGHNASLTIVSREEGSGARSSFDNFANIQNLRRDMQLIISQGSGAVINAVRTNPQAIGYIASGLITSDVRALSINGVHFSEISANSGDYPFTTAFYIVLPTEPTSYAKDFVNWIISPKGQAIVRQLGYIPIGYVE